MAFHPHIDKHRHLPVIPGIIGYFPFHAVREDRPALFAGAGLSAGHFMVVRHLKVWEL